MEENVALDSSKQKKFTKSIKKLLNKKNAEPKTKSDGEGKIKSGRVGKKKRNPRGLVYLGHIPHGFYEHEMTQYFRQFGVVTNARVIKSRRTGRSKGYAFVEFKEPAVAQVVAETMNNYLMGKRLIKASYIPPEKQRRAFRKRWNAVNNPANEYRMKIKKLHNANKDEKGELQRAKRILTNITTTKQKLKELGIDYDFFTPVDVPEQLQQGVHIKKEDNDNKKSIKKDEIKKESKVKAKIEQDTKPVNNKKTKKEIVQDTKPINNKKAKQEIEQDPKPINNKKAKQEIGQDTKSIKNNKLKQEIEQDTKPIKNKKAKQEIEEVKPIKTKKSQTKEMKTEQDDLQQTKKDSLKGKGVKLLEDFMKFKQDSDNDSDSSEDFDSDEFEKMMQSDEEDDLESDESGTESEDDASESDSEESEEEPPIKKNKSVVPKVVPVQSKKGAGNQTQQQKHQPIQQSRQQQTSKIQLKPQTQFASAKNSKFEKKGRQKPRNKQFKKK